MQRYLNVSLFSPFSNCTVCTDMESDLGRGGSWCLEDPCLLTLTSPWPRLTTRACWWRPCTGTEAVETSLHCEDTMEAVSISAEGPIVNTTI